jgi:hypothetical protein
VRRHTLIALLLTGIGIAGLAFVVLSATSVRDYIADTYEFVGTEPVPGDEGDESLVYASAEPVSETAQDIAEARKPADQRVTEAGVFMRYQKDIVTVVPREGGTRILVDDEESGYRRGFVYLGGWWGLNRGRAETVRGGGPGGGK